MNNVLFLETSALLSVFFQEEAGNAITSKLKNASRIIASRLIKIEAERSVYRLGIEQKDLERNIPDLLRELKLFWPKVDFIEMTRQICDSAGALLPHSRLRSLDAIHLATYFMIREHYPNIEMVSLDERILAEVIT